MWCMIDVRLNLYAICSDLNCNAPKNNTTDNNKYNPGENEKKKKNIWNDKLRARNKKCIAIEKN